MNDTVLTPDRQFLVGIADAAALCGISERGFKALLSAGKVGPEPVRLGERVLFARVELESWAASGHGGRLPDRQAWAAMKGGTA